MAPRDDSTEPPELIRVAGAGYPSARRSDPDSDPVDLDPAEDLDPVDDRYPAADLHPVDDPGEDFDRDDDPGPGDGPDPADDLDPAAGADPAPMPPRPARRRAPLPVAAATAAVWAAFVSLLPAVLVLQILRWAEPEPASLLGALRAAAAGWLLGHGVSLETSAGTVGLAPLAITVLAGWRLSRAGLQITRITGRRPGRYAPAALGVGAVAVGYGLCGAFVAALVDGPGWGVPAVRAGLVCAGFAAGFAGLGAARAVGAGPALSGRLPDVLRQGGRAGLVATFGLFAAGAGLVGAAVAVSGGEAADTLVAYRTGIAGQLGLTLLCLAYAPNLAVWAVAYLVGPGFSVGVDTAVRGSEVALGPLPPLPVFAALPAGPLPTVGAMLLVVPVLAGAVAGWLLARGRSERGWGLPGWARDARGWAKLVGSAVVTGLVSGGLTGLAAWISSGPLGSGDLATIGPVPWLVAVFTTATVMVGALLGAAVTAGLVRR